MTKNKVKNILAAIASILFVSTVVAQDEFDTLDTILTEVVINGKVDYRALQKHQTSLYALDSTWKQKGLNNSIAVLINWYNVKVLTAILVRPDLISVKNDPAFFTRGNPSLNDIEEHLREPLKDPLLHFALVCGAMDCPNLLNKAYRPIALRAQLEKQARLTLNDPLFIRWDENESAVRLSMIFQWYAEDFPKGHEALISWINLYREVPISTTAKVGYYEYDWRLNDVQNVDQLKEGFSLSTYTPSQLLGQGQVEFQLFNNLYSQTGFKDNSGAFVSSGERQNYFTQYLSILTGIGKTGRINVGLDYVHRTVRLDDIDSSPFKTLLFSNTDNARSQPGQIGPKIKFVPIKNVNNLSVQSTFYFPLYADGEAHPWFDYDRYTWWTRAFYDINRTNWQVFTEIDLLARFDKTGGMNQTIAEIPVSLFLSYFPVNDLTIYGMSQFSHTLFSDGSYFLQSGGGLKYRPTKKLEFELLYTNFVASKNQGAGATGNLGIRYVH